MCINITEYQIFRPVSKTLVLLLQIEPKLLFTVNAVVYNGKVHDHLAKVSGVVKVGRLEVGSELRR